MPSCNQPRLATFVSKSRPVSSNESSLTSPFQDARLTVRWLLDCEEGMKPIGMDLLGLVLQIVSLNRFSQDIGCVVVQLVLENKQAHNIL